MFVLNKGFNIKTKLEQLESENQNLKRRIKLLEKRLAKFRTKNNDLTQEITELDQEIEVVKATKEKTIRIKTCPKCGRELQIIDISHSKMELCTNNKCDYRKIIKYKQGSKRDIIT